MFCRNGQEVQNNLRFEANCTLINNAFNHGYDAAIEWIGKSGFSDKELEDYDSRVIRSMPGFEMGRWMNWVNQNIHNEQAVTQLLRNQFDCWTQIDHQAAGEGLEAASEGAAKTAAAKSYAWTIAPYYPEKAARWVEALPVGNERNRIMQQVMAKWRTTDAAAADAFTKKHGLK